MSLTRINLDQEITAIINIPETVGTETYPYTIKLASDGSTFASGNLTHIVDSDWKIAFTPTSGDTYLLRVPHLTITSFVFKEDYLVEEGVDVSLASGTYCTKSDIAGLGAEFTIPTAWSDSDVETLISDTEQVINDLINDDYRGTSTVTITGDGTGDSLFQTRRYTNLPIVSITSITWRADVSDDFESTNAWTTDDYYASKYFIEATGSYSGARYSNKEKFERGIRNFQIVGVFGHATVPIGIKRACTLLCRETINPGYLNQLDMTSVAWSDFKYTISSNKKNITTLTGYPIVDTLLKRYVNKSTYFMKA